MNDNEIDSLFQHQPEMPPQLKEQIRAGIMRDTRPVEPMRGNAFYGLALWILFGAVAILFAFVIGVRGLPLLSWQEAGGILGTLLVLGLISSAALARSMRPGSGNLPSWLLGGVSLIAYQALVLIFFRDYSFADFVENGIVCLGLGVLCGALAAVPIWLILRRGFIVERLRAGAIAGLVSGLAGLSALTLHCPRLTTPHTAIWHAAVLLVCVGVGATLGRIFR